MNSDQVKAYYQKYERYDWIDDTRYPAKLFHLMRANHIATLANRLIRPDWKVIDLGCGTGLVTRKLKGRVTGIDINGWALTRARFHCSINTRFEQSDAENLSLSDNYIDIVVCSDVLEHLPHPQTALSEIHRVLLKGGYLIGEVPSRSFIWNYRKLCGSTYKEREPFHHNYTIPEVMTMLHQFKPQRIQLAVMGFEISFIARKDAE